MRRKAIFLITAVCVLGAASCKNPDAEPSDVRQEIQSGQSGEQETGESTADNSENAAENGAGAADTNLRGTRIENQTFEVELEPLGEIRFVSYAPDSEENPRGDVRFVIEQNGQELCELEGMTAESGGVRDRETFVQVQAVSFPDYNGDGYADIITICTYRPDDGEQYDEVRIYEGSADGIFALQRELSQETGSALAEKSISGVLGFLGADNRKEDGAGEPIVGTGDTWQEAYIDNLQKKRDAELNNGYVLICLDDDEIPELVEIGNCEAVGCRVIHYSDGAAYEMQLSRLHFTYIEKSGLLCNSEGHMDYYYDVVYLLKGGMLEPIAVGQWGWLDDEVYGKFDESENPLYVYEWNGVRMEEEDYEKQLNQVYDTSKMQEGYLWDEWYSEDEMTALLQEM